MFAYNIKGKHIPIFSQYYSLSYEFQYEQNNIMVVDKNEKSVEV